MKFVGTDFVPSPLHHVPLSPMAKKYATFGDIKGAERDHWLRGAVKLLAGKIADASFKIKGAITAAVALPIRSLSLVSL